jgi:hypothetical protein
MARKQSVKKSNRKKQSKKSQSRTGAPSFSLPPHAEYYALLIVALVWLLLIILQPKAFWVVDNGSKFIQTASVLSPDTEGAALLYPIAELDPDFEFNPQPAPWTTRSGSALYSQYPPAFAFASAPFYKLLGHRGLFLLPWLAGLLALLALARLFGKTEQNRALIVAACGLATPLLFYGILFWEHTIVCALVLSAFALLFESDSKAKQLAAGVLFGLAVWFREESAVWLVTIPTMIILVERQSISLKSRLVEVAIPACGVIGSLSLMLLFQYWATGAALGFHVSANALAIGGENWIIDHLKAAYTLLVSADLDWRITVIFWVCLSLWAITEIADAHRTFKRIAAAILLAGIALVIYRHFSANDPSQFLLDANALPATIPLALGVLALRRANLHRNTKIMLASSALFIAIIALAAPLDVARGFHFSPRLLLPAALIFSAASVTFLSGSRTRFLLGGLIAAGLLFNVIAVGTIFEKKKYNQTVSDMLLDAPETDILSISYWFPGEYPEVYLQKRVWRITNLDDMKNAYSRFRKHESDPEPLVASPMPIPYYEEVLFEPQTRLSIFHTWIYRY